MKDVKFIDVVLDVSGKNGGNKDIVPVAEFEQGLLTKYPDYEIADSSLSVHQFGVRWIAILVKK